jgi:CubicO group peptidase (beta-lactamase class C family)
MPKSVAETSVTGNRNCSWVTEQFALATLRTTRYDSRMRQLAFLAIAGAGLSLVTGLASADQVDSLIKDEMRQHQVVGLACLVLSDGRPIKTVCRGVANLEWNVPVTKDTVFEIGSVTKQFTAACILLLAEERKLSVDDKISRYLPNTPPAWASITVRHLLTHTSGITNYDAINGFELRQHLTQAEFIRKLAPFPLGFQPGEKWSYCNSGFNLLGYIIEDVSGTNYWGFLCQRILGPLEMTHTTRRDPRVIIPRRADGYEMKDHVRINRDYDLTDLFAAGTIASTVADLAKWNAALDGNKLLNESSKELWWTPTRVNNGGIKEYGFGWYLNPLEGHKNIGHSGSTSGFSASLQRFPDDHLCVIVLANTDELGFSTKLAKKVAVLYFKKEAATR